MKKITMLSALFFLSLANAQVPKETQFVSGQFGFSTTKDESNNSSSDSYRFLPTYGYFFAPNWAVAVSAGYRQTTDHSTTKNANFENLNLEIPERSIISIVGKSGSGKSTLLNMIGLLEDFEIGSIELFGNTLPKINSSKATQIRRNKISYLFQSYALINDMTVTQNLLLSLHFTDLSTNEKKNKLVLVLDELELNHLKKSKINTLSGGEQQRVALARAILKPSQLILCDEPTGALDYKTGKQILKLLQDTCRNEKMTVIIITHNSAISPMADKIIKFKNGAVSDIIINKTPKNIADIEW